MLIRVINPNTTLSMRALIEACARAVAGTGTVVEAVSPSMGPASNESQYDEALGAAPGGRGRVRAASRQALRRLLRDFTRKQ